MVIHIYMKGRGTLDRKNIWVNMKDVFPDSFVLKETDACI